MKQVNLKELYPDVYKENFTVEVSDEVYSALRLFEKKDMAASRKKFRHKAHYSLDAADGIENSTVECVKNPEELLVTRETEIELLDMLNELPVVQAKRLYSKFFLGMSTAEIAACDGVDASNVRAAIRRGLKALQKKLKNFSE